MTEAAPLLRPVPAVVVLGLLLLAGAQAAAEPPASGLSLGANPFGVFFGRNGANVPVALDLGAGVARASAIVAEETCLECADYAAAGVPVALMVKSNRWYDQPSDPPDDLVAYQAALGRLLDATRPAVVMVENEMDWQHFWAGGPSEYLATLRAACEVAHARGIPCADGALLYPTVRRMVYQHYVDAGDTAGAVSYAVRSSSFWNPLDYLEIINPGNAGIVKARAAYGHAFLDGFAAAGADYVNFHFFGWEPSALRETIAYLHEATGLPVGSNEIAHHDHHNPVSVMGQMTVALEQDMAFAIWYSVDRAPNYALQNPDDSLRAHGLAFKGFVLASDLAGHAGNTTSAQAASGSPWYGTSARSLPPGP